MAKTHEERRSRQRVNFRVPFRLRILEDPAGETFAAETVNLSEGGVCFRSHRALRVGTPLQLSLRMPREITGHSPVDVECRARVVHSGRNGTREGMVETGAFFEEIEPVAAYTDSRASAVP